MMSSKPFLSLEKTSALCGGYVPVHYKCIIKRFMDRLANRKRYPLCINGLIVVNVYFNKIFPVIVSFTISPSTTENQRKKILSDASYILADQNQWNNKIMNCIGMFESPKL